MVKEFNIKEYYWKNDINYRNYPEKYKVGKGEQGVLLCEPYKSEIVKHWKFRSPDIAKISSEKIYDMFLNYLKKDDFVGADMARKFIQMGFTRARRYANYKGGRKYDKENGEQLQKGTGDDQKIESADIFFKKWKIVEDNAKYKNLKSAWKEKYG